MSWKTLESAPKDGSIVLLYTPAFNGDYIRTGRYHRGKWISVSGGARRNATHWMPMPEMPK